MWDKEEENSGKNLKNADDENAESACESGTVEF